MSIYFVSENPEGHTEELRKAVKTAIQRRFPHALEDPVFSFAYDQPQQVFLKGPASLFWGRIFSYKITLADAYRIEQEVGQLAKTFSQGIQPCLFFPQAEAAALDSLGQLRPKPAMFEYYALESDAGKSLAVRPIQQEACEKTSLEPYSYYRSSRLSREELAELIDLSCSLKKLACAPASLI